MLSRLVLVSACMFLLPLTAVADDKAAAAQAAPKADRELNLVYQQLITRLENLDPTRKKALVDAELAWIKFRDLECTFQGSATGGSTPDRLLYDRYLATLTTERARELRETLAKTAGE
ncbi:MAG: DUF1311 domain-containing protein [Deltaproteobacteria bacterium]|nr:DUF1311 domain-containing protein [Deltaproteobacteria bacterium]